MASLPWITRFCVLRLFIFNVSGVYQEGGSWSASFEVDVCGCLDPSVRRRFFLWKILPVECFNRCSDAGLMAAARLFHASLGIGIACLEKMK